MQSEFFGYLESSLSRYFLWESLKHLATSVRTGEAHPHSEQPWDMVSPRCHQHVRALCMGSVTMWELLLSAVTRSVLWVPVRGLLWPLFCIPLQF